MSDKEIAPTVALATTTAKAGDITMTGPLQAAIDHAYAVFAPYAERFTAHVCQCNSCFSAEDRDRLLELPLREIDGALLDQYSWSAHGHDDDGPRSKDLRYLLPRYFELFALNDPKLHDAPECNLTQLGRTAWRARWPSAEVEAIDWYFDALLVACLSNSSVNGGWSRHSGSRYRCALPLDDFLGMLIRAGADIARMLKILDAAPDPAAALHVATLRFVLQTDERGTRLGNNHLDPDFLDAAFALGAYVASPRATSRIETCFFQLSDPVAQQMLSDALLLFPSRSLDTD